MTLNRISLEVTLVYILPISITKFLDFNEPDIKKAKNKVEKVQHCIYVAALHTILRAMQGMRILAFWVQFA